VRGKGNLENAGKWFLAAGRLGSADEQYRYGVALLNGTFGFVKKETVAVRRLRSSGD